MPGALGNVHIDTFLTGVAAGYQNSDYIADQVLPVVPSAKETGKIAGYGNEHYRLDFNPRGMGGDAPRGDWQAITPVTFAAKDWEFEKPVDDREIPYYDDPFDAFRDATEVVTQKIMAKREDIVGTMFTTAGNFGSTTAAGTTWVTSATADPVGNLRTAMEAIRARTGISYTNMIAVMGSALWNKMVQCDKVKALYLSTIPGAAAPAVIQPSALAAAVGIGGFYVGPGVKLTSREGAADAFTDLWGTSTVGVVVKSARPSLMNPGWGVMISPTVPGFKGAYVAVDRYREERKRSTIIRAAALLDVVSVTPTLGQQITGC